MSSLLPFVDFLDPWDVFERASWSLDSDTERPEQTEGKNESNRKRGGRKGWVPRVEVTEDEQGNLNLDAEVPGVNSENLQLDVREGSLVISGVKRRQTEVTQNQVENDKDEVKRPPAKKSKKDHPYVYSERQYGKFRRVVKLPKEVDVSKITASCKDGVLHVFIPVQEEASKISVPIEFS
ncbi:Small heat shock protein C4 [Galdieria sulphuraria]|uniref:Heat shock protein, Hsp20 family n=1 Tax=Galdieria sulphuraria TaxID=130081 RepID=M2W6A1_GALSU|nr:heat shock protein, Hsp20 family [Galdieria sulphuraria]EME31286.1 heat shock protein, Hsp20 family [Galdieria sulphuraria]GJD07715.1 Small heat shock protein C4 [Galdieria sulphuraria]|eukprot:XP_005707806.1 heat shock protein, Hsp20 family [Galdieria sulphuraria]